MRVPPGVAIRVRGECTANPPRLLRDARDWEGLAWLVHRHAATLLAQGRAQTVEDWLAEMPAAIIEEQPWLLFWRGIGALGWRHAECQRALQQAFHS